MSQGIVQPEQGLALARYVVDASVGIKLFFQDELSDKAYAVFSGLGTDPPVGLLVPDLFYIECANVLWKYVRWSGMPLNTALENLADLGDLALLVTPTSELMEPALKKAVELSITAYDACYVALADRLGITLLTADKKLAHLVPAALWLGEL